MLPPAAFADPAVLDWEIENLYGGWVCLGHASLVAEPGSYLMREIGETSVFALADERRGAAGLPQHVPPSRLAPGLKRSEGSVRRRIQCPYHAWSYGLDGGLAAAPHMDEVEDFDRSCFGLIEVRSAVVAGLLLADLSGEAPDPVAHVGDLAKRLAQLEAAGAGARGLAHLRGERELEGDRRELQRVPPLPGRPSRS